MSLPQDNDHSARQAAERVLEPQHNAAGLVRSFAPVPEDKKDPAALFQALTEECYKAHSGDLTRAEAMQVAQAHSLDAIFAALAQHARANMGHHLEATERYMRLALRAQNQCRATLETLATVKNPPLVIAGQANIAAGPQQVNNGRVREAGQGGRARMEIEDRQSRLLEQCHGKWLDPGAASAAGGSDKDLEAVGTVNRSPHT